MAKSAEGLLYQRYHARIEVDTLGRKLYEMQKIAVGPVVTVGTEGDVTTGPTVTTAKMGVRARERDGDNDNCSTNGKRGGEKGTLCENAAACVGSYIREKIIRTQHSDLDPALESCRIEAQPTAFPTSRPREVVVAVRETVEKSRGCNRLCNPTATPEWRAEEAEAENVVTQRGLNNLRVIQLRLTNVE